MPPSEPLVDATEQVAPASDVPAHLLGTAAPQEPIQRGACPRCGAFHSAPLMRSDRVEYQLCGECGRVWVERYPADGFPTSRASIGHRGLWTRFLAGVTAVARLIAAQQA